MILAWANSHHYAEILEKVKGCLFLGVPHQGADLAYWADMPARIVPLVTFGFFGNRRFLKSLKKNSKDWMQISRDFVHRSAQLHIRSFFETEKLGDVVVCSFPITWLLFSFSFCLFPFPAIAVAKNR